MYSAVLMLALTAGSETADFGRHGCTTGYTGCSCPVVAKSHGCSSSCHGGLFARHGCHSAAPVCSTYRAPVVATCSYGCASSCHGGGLFARMRERHNCHGCTAVTTCCTPVVTTCGTPVMEKKAMPKGEGLPPPVDKKKVQAAAPATILVSLPAGASLTVDGAATKSTAAQRTLITPALEVNGEYAYTLRAEFVSEGRTLVQTQQVNVRGGQTSTVEFNFSTEVASR
jgi:uncharacterized protein (TIGR03000 family)